MFRNILARAQRNALKDNHSRLFRQSVKQGANTLPKPIDLQREYIEKAIQIEPTLSTVSPQMWQTAYQTFANHGLNTFNFLQIVTGNPKLVSRPPQKIIDSLEYWRSCQFGENYLFLLLTKYPTLMDITDQRHLLKQVEFLRSYVGSIKNVWKVLMYCPDLIQQPAKVTESKIKYLKEVMRIQIPEMVKSEALSKPLEEIKCRHVFLMRLGLFKPRPLKADPNEPSKNPRLYKITDMSEKAFATKLCHVTLPEYEAFKELYFKEVQKAENHDEEEDELNENTYEKHTNKTKKKSKRNKKLK